MLKNTALALACLTVAFGQSPAIAQGQDSSTWERDLQVIATLIAGDYDNANQAYFDVRADRSVKHKNVHATIEKIDAPFAGDYVFKAQTITKSDPAQIAYYVWAFSTDDKAKAVRMRSWQLADDSDTISEITLSGLPSCDLHWYREAAQFKTNTKKSCKGQNPIAMVLSEQQVWLQFDRKTPSYELQRARRFECYADIPGVGGGRDIPYKRYEDFVTHDLGGEFWFTDEDGRELGVSLFRVDWPLNNYVGIFTRDSFVIYVKEMIDGKSKEIAYAFTVPEADRIGINLKWMLVNCYMQSNRDTTPFM